MGKLCDKCCMKKENEEIDNIQNDLNKKNNFDIKIQTKNFIMKRFDSPWEHYKEVNDLGIGTYGLVKKVLLISSSIPRALKIIPKSKLIKGVNNSMVINEIEILRNLDHPNIMKIYEYYEDNKNFYIVGEYCDSGDLYSKLEKLDNFSEVIVKIIMKKILSAIAYLHSKKILHGDIKIENVLLNTSTKRKLRKTFTRLNQESNLESLQKELNKNLKEEDYSKSTKEFFEDIDKYEIKLIDFGCSKIFTKNKKIITYSNSNEQTEIIENNDEKKENKELIRGASLYCSPEVIANHYDEKCDEWACGVLMYILLCGSPPFYGKKDEEIFRNIKKGNFHFYYPQFKNVSDNAKDLISQLLKYDKNKRITAKDALNHPFFNENINLKQEIDINILIRLKNLKIYNKIQQAVIAYLTMNFIDKDEEKKLRDVFRFIDKKSSGIIKKDDIKKAFQENNLEIDEDNLKNIFDILDSDSNGYIEYQEFLRALVDKENLFSENNLKQVFELFDKDKSGQITWDDLYGIFYQSENKNINEEIIQKFLEEINMKKEDSINFEQFSKIMKNCL